MISYECAPMEGVTDFDFRNVQSRHFMSASCYYTPFISPTQNHLFTPRQMREILPEHNEGIHLVPQLIGHNAEDFIWATGELKSMGYDEVNLNLGCPSSTVVSKKKGSGLLCEQELLRRFLDEIFEKSPLKISVKTRIGLNSPEEFASLIELYNRYPMEKLIVHCRVQSQQYGGSPDMDAWRMALRLCKMPLCYNGDIFDRNRAEDFAREYPETKNIMIGRGLAANPKLIGEIHGDSPVTAEELKSFHDELYAACRQRLGAEKPLLLHMKELWYYLSRSFENSEKPLKAIRKSQNEAEYLAAVNDLFRRCPFLNPNPSFG